MSKEPLKKRTKRQSRQVDEQRQTRQSTLIDFCKRASAVKEDRNVCFRAAVNEGNYKLLKYSLISW